MPLPRVYQIRSKEGWDEFFDDFKKEDQDYQNYVKYFNAATDLNLKGDYLGAFKAYSTAEVFLGRSLATLESYNDGFQKRYAAKTADKPRISAEDKKAVEKQMSDFLDDLYRRTTMVSTYRERAAIQIPLEQLQPKKSVPEAATKKTDLPKLSANALEKVLNDLDNRHLDGASLKYYHAENFFEEKNYQRAIETFQEVIVQVAKQNLKSDVPFLQHVQSKIQDAQRLLAESQHVQSERYSSGSDSSSPASVGSEDLSPTSSPDTTVRASTKTLEQNPLFTSNAPRVSQRDFVNPLYTASQQQVANTNAAKQSASRSEAVKQWKEHFSGMQEHNSYKRALEVLKEGDKFTEAQDYSSAIERYESALNTLKNFKEVVTRPISLQDFEPKDRLAINAQRTNALHGILESIKSGERQLGYAHKMAEEAKRQPLSEEQAHQEIDQALDQRKTTFREEQASQPGSQSAVAASQPQSIAGTTPPSAARSSNMSEVGELLANMSFSGSSGGGSSPRSVSDTVMPATKSGQSSGRATESQAEDDLDRLLKQLDEKSTMEQTATPGAGGGPHHLSSQAQMLIEMAGTKNPDKIKETSLRNAIENFQQNDENYQRYLEYQKKAEKSYEDGNLGQASIAVEVAGVYLQACKTTIQIYDQQLQKMPHLQQSTLKSDISLLEHNIDRLIEFTTGFKSEVDKEVEKKQHPQTATNRQDSPGSTSSDFKSSDPGRGSSGPGSGPGK